MFGGSLETQRPNQQAAMVLAGGNEVVSVRLWQDPLEAVYSHWSRILAYAETNKKLPPGTSLPNTIKNWTTERKSPELHLFVMAPGTPYAEDVENRRRQRYAVVTALAELDYVPKSADRIGYFVAPDFASPAGLGEIGVSDRCSPQSLGSGDETPVRYNPASGCMIIGFEVFERPSRAAIGDDDHWQSIVVFWLNSEDFQPNGLERIAAVMAALSEDGSPISVLLGPNTSGILKSFLSGADDESDHKDDRASHFLERSSTFPDSGHALFSEGEPISTSAQFTLQVARKGLPRIKDQAKFDDCLKDSQPNDVKELERCLDAQVEPTWWNATDWVTTVATRWIWSKKHGLEPSSLRKKIKERRAQLHILSTLATVPLDVLFDDPTYRIEDVAQGPVVEARLANDLRVASFASLVARDDLVLVDVLHELAARGACSTDRPILAIVSEQDTVYGRQLADIIVDRVPTNNLQGLCEFHVQEFGYLSGVDGEAYPDSSGQDQSRNDVRKDESATGGQENEASVGAPFVRNSRRERAVGDAQLDYVRRLADLINQANDGDAGGFAAIGVLGSDVYDKQLILQALRERLPSSTFFTTDLDARLTDPDVNRWTRNLIVGSAYGLSAQHQQGAGFRDTYQTALYRAVRLAHQLPAKPAAPYLKQTCAIFGDPYLCAPSPKLFEIGLTGAVDITNCREFCAKAESIHGDVGHIKLNPNLRTRFKANVVVFVPLVVLTIVSFWLAWRLGSKGYEFRRNAYVRVGTIGSISIVWLAAAVLWWTQPGYEPWAFFEGVSTVPTLVLEVTTTVFSAAMIMIVLGRIKQGDDDAAAEFSLPKSSVGQTPLAWTDRFRPILQLEEREPQGTLSVNAIWDTHLHNGVLHARLFRILSPAIVFAGFGILFLETHPEPLLSRNLDLAAALNRGAMIVGALTAVLFWSDTLKLERALIRNLAWSNVEGFEVRTGTSEFDRQMFQRRRAMDLIVLRTEIASPIVVLPFILLPFLMLARSTVFEGWVWSWNVLALFAGFGIYLLVNALLFQTEAAQARDRIRDHLERQRYGVMESKPKLRQIKLMVDDICGIRQGAFVRWTSHPILQSLALVVGGLVLIALLNFLFGVAGVA